MVLFLIVRLPPVSYRMDTLFPVPPRFRSLGDGEGPGTTTHGSERDWAWSADVGHYVKVEQDVVVVWRWDQSSPERYKHRTISDNIVRFQTYLEERQPSSASSVVGHFMAIYRQVRTLVGPEVTGPEALQAFPILLAEDNTGTQVALPKTDWPNT